MVPIAAGACVPSDRLDRQPAVMFSVVLCTYNRAGMLGRAVKEVLDQSWTDFDLIVVDDGSTDETKDVLSAFDDSRLKVVHRENGGLSAARNTGLGLATGRFVVSLDDDDTVSPRWLSGLARNVDDSTGFTSCTCYLAFPDGKRLRMDAERDAVHPEILGIFMAGTFAIDRSVLLAVGGFAEAIRISHQTEMLLRALPEMVRQGMTAALTDEPLITIERRDPKDRLRSRPDDALHGAEYLIDQHGELLATNPEVLADFHAVAGVNAARLGLNKLARKHFYRAVRKQPRASKHLFRLGISLVTPVARRVWRAAG